MRSLLLKGGATVLTLVAAAASAVYVSAHVKNSAAPLHPGVMGARTSVLAGGKLQLSSSVRSADVQAVTSTASS
jgi:hypothetical protein